MSQTPLGVDDRLDSWKAIADYLGRDVATVRRWEKAQHLPIRRVPGGTGRSVFAFRSEIDAWLKAGSARTIETESAPQTIPDPPASTVTPRTARWRLPAAVLAATLLSASVAWVIAFSRSTAPALTLDVTPTAIVARASDGSERWRHPFETGWRVFAGQRPAEPLGDGAYVVSTLYGVRTTDEAVRGGELLWLTDGGRAARRFMFDDQVGFRQRRFDGPWALTEYRLHPQLRADRMVVAAHHYQWWPGLVALLDERWQRSATFVNAGWVEHVSFAASDRLLIAGFFNPLDGGMVALLDTGAMNGQSPPAGDASYRCSSCSTDLPLQYVVMPRSELNVVLGAPFNRAQVQSTGGRVLVRTVEVPVATGQAPEALYEFSPSLDLLQSTYGDRYWEMHASLERSGRLSHTRAQCPERDGPPFIHVWRRATGWMKHVRAPAG